jgi:uncharacterized membrane protein (DUF2068 family)
VPRRRDEIPGTERPRRFLPKFHYELIACGFKGHELVGTDAARVRPADELIVREADGFRWYRCLRCDAWIPLAPPSTPASEHPPDRDRVELPLRGKPLRDKFVLRLIAVDRALHFVLLGTLAVLIFVFLGNRQTLQQDFSRFLASFQSAIGGPAGSGQHGILGELSKLFSLSNERLEVTGIVVAAYALLEGVEAVGLWLAKRWAEYLTFVATVSLLPLEIYELSNRVSVLKVVALVVNLAIVMYLLFAKRLFGLRGGGAAERRERERDIGWQALERMAPGRIEGRS